MRGPGMVALAATMLTGCVTTETVQFKSSGPTQQALMRDGQSALSSRQKRSLVLIRPASREIATNGRPVFVVGIYNLSNQPMDFRVGQVEVVQMVGESEHPIQVVTYEMLVQEEKNKQVARAILGGLAVAANSYSAAQAGRGYYTTPSGRTGTFYSPTAAAIAQDRAAAQNDAVISSIVERGQANLAQLEQGVIKDNTLLPGEWYGGQLHLAPPAEQGSARKEYSITIGVGGERHTLLVSQGPAT